MRNRLTNPLLVVAGLLVAAGGYIHLREWLDTYRDVPSAAPGSFVVRVGFPVNALVSLVFAIALVGAAARFARYVTPIVAGAFAFQAASLAALILSRTGSVLGWKEPVWTDGANQARAVEIAALIVLACVIALAMAAQRPAPPRLARET